jgi:putative membrane protein
MTRTSRPARHAALLALAVTLVACGKKDDAATDTTAGLSTAAVSPGATTATTPAAAPAPAAPSDPQIAHIAVTANSIDSAAGVTAKQKGSAKDVKDFAQMMITDHGTVNKQAVALAQKLGVTPEDNDVSRSLKAGADSSATALQGKTGADFDRAYIDREVGYHQAVLDALDNTLIPSAQNAELKALLEKVRPNVAAHLQRAKAIQTSLASKT